MVPADSDRIPRVPPYSGVQPDRISYVYRTVTSYGRPFHTVPLMILLFMSTLQPRYCLNKIGLGFFHFARHYSENHCCFLFLRVLRCFSSPGLASPALYIQAGIIEVRLYWVSPFGYPRIYARLQLPVAFRRWPRPSSPSSA